MSSNSHPINPTAFASALTSLPLGSLYTKGAEIQNSISHLQRSNLELEQYIQEAPGGDNDCEEAVKENEVVIERMRERIDLLKVEVEGRGQSWMGGEEEGDVDGEGGEGGNDTSGVNGSMEMSGEQGGAGNTVSGQSRTQPQDDDNAGSEDRGVHL